MCQRERERKIFTDKSIDRLLQVYFSFSQQAYFVLRVSERERETERSYERKNIKKKKRRIDKRQFQRERESERDEYERERGR